MPISSDITLAAPFVAVENTEDAGIITLGDIPTTRYAYIRQINGTTTGYAEGDKILYTPINGTYIITVSDVAYTVIRDTDIILKEVTPP